MLWGTFPVPDPMDSGGLMISVDVGLLLSQILLGRHVSQLISRPFEYRRLCSGGTLGPAGIMYVSLAHEIGRG